MFKKIAALATAAVLCAGLMAGCGASSTTADTSYSAENPLVLTLAHGLSEAHTVHIAMTQFAEEVNEKTGGRVQVKIFPNGQLGSENENLEQLQAGVIAMTKVSAPGLATYNEAYNAFGLPYIFNDTEDFYHVMDSQQMQDFFLSTGKHGEVCKVYSVDQHAMIPDVLIMSEKVWKQISPEDQEIILEAAHNSTEAHKVMWDTAIEEAVKEAQETMGVEFVYDVDKEAFREATQPMIEAYEEQYPGVKTLMDTIEAAREGE